MPCNGLRAPGGRAPRRVLYVDLSPSSGGSIHSLLSLLTHLDRARWEPVVAIAARNPALTRFKALGVSMWLVETGVGARRTPTLGQRAAAHPVTGRLWRWPWFARVWGAARWGRRMATRIWPQSRALARIIREAGVDAVHLNDALTMSRPGVVAAAWTGRPSLCHVRSYDRLGRGDRWLAGRIQHFIYISRALQQSYQAQGIAPGRGDVVYNGIDLARFEGMVSRDEARRALGIPRDAWVVTALGRLVPWKGQEVFLRTIARLTGRWSNLVGLVVGGEEPYAPGYRERLQMLAEQLSVARTVRFLGHRKDIPLILAATDVVVHLPVEPEPFGRVVVEAMAARRPIVAAAIGAIPELVRDGIDGLLVPPGDEAGVADALAGLMSDAALRERMGKAGRSRAERDFTVERYARGVMAVYDRLGW
ncbi:MAG: glycosyltransferase family 4 protein [Anaerolineae bacterium]|nr:glycosyltransferase family 4 protein [Anaerolineae bacterium]